MRFTVSLRYGVFFVAVVRVVWWVLREVCGVTYHCTIYYTLCSVTNAPLPTHYLPSCITTPPPPPPVPQNRQQLLTSSLSQPQPPVCWWSGTLPSTLTARLPPTTSTTALWRRGMQRSTEVGTGEHVQLCH